jgi:hypothetical protein
VINSFTIASTSPASRDIATGFALLPLLPKPVVAGMPIKVIGSGIHTIRHIENQYTFIS